MEVTSDQIRAARALLRLDQGELARRADVSVVTIRRIEGAEGGARVAAASLNGVRDALELSGVEFIADGVRRRPQVRPDARALFEDLQAIGRRSAARQQGLEQMTEADLYDENGLPG